MREYLKSRGLRLKQGELNGYRVETGSGEHTSLEVVLNDENRSQCTLRLKDGQCYARAFLAQKQSLNVRVSNPTTVREFEKDVVGIKAWNQWTEENGVASSQTRKRCDTVDISELCPYLGALGFAGTVVLYFTNPGGGVVATVALADFLAAGCALNGIYEDFNRCELDKIKVCRERNCYENYGVITCNPVPEITLTPVC